MPFCDKRCISRGVTVIGYSRLFSYIITGIRITKWSLCAKFKINDHVLLARAETLLTLAYILISFFLDLFWIRMEFQRYFRVNMKIDPGFVC